MHLDFDHNAHRPVRNDSRERDNLIRRIDQLQAGRQPVQGAYMGMQSRSFNEFASSHQMARSLVFGQIASATGSLGMDSWNLSEGNMHVFSANLQPRLEAQSSNPYSLP